MQPEEGKKYLTTTGKIVEITRKAKHYSNNYWIGVIDFGDYENVALFNKEGVQSQWSDVGKLKEEYREVREAEFYIVADEYEIEAFPRLDLDYFNHYYNLEDAKAGEHDAEIYKVNIEEIR